MSFQNLGLSEALVHGVQRMGYVDPTPIQLRAIPLILAPALMIVMGAIIACVIAGLLAPLLQMFRWLIW